MTTKTLIVLFCLSWGVVLGLDYLQGQGVLPKPLISADQEEELSPDEIRRLMPN
jgi:hypothetical protein